MRGMLLIVFALTVPTASAAPVPKHLMPKAEDPATRRANLMKLAQIYDSMTPEAAAPIVKSMADAGKLDDAAEILLLMRERNAARLLETMNDRPTMAQILDRIRTIQTPKGLAPTPRAVK